MVRFKPIIIVPVGNKNENVFEKHVMTSDAEKFAKNFDLDFIETSSLKNEKIENMFYSIASAALLKKLQMRSIEDRKITILKKNENESKCC